jgi:hypothetical protein
VYFCVLYEFCNAQALFPCTAPSVWPIQWKETGQTVCVCLCVCTCVCMYVYIYIYIYMYIFLSLVSPSGPRPSLWGSSITLRHTTFDRTPQDERSSRRRYLYLTTHPHSQETDIYPPPRWDSNPLSQQSNDSRPTPYIVFIYNVD